MYAKVTVSSISIYEGSSCVYQSLTTTEYKDGLEHCKSLCIPMYMTEQTRQNIYQEHDIEIPRYLMLEVAS